MSLSRPALRLSQSSRTEIERIFDDARPADPDKLSGYNYRGVSMGLPSLIEKLSWKKFAKAFVRAKDGSVCGYNVRIRDDGLHSPWTPKLRSDAPHLFGHFHVIREEEETILDYSQESFGLSPLRTLRDPIRALDSDCNILLGRSLVQVGRRRFSTPSWFVLEKGSVSVDCSKLDPHSSL